MKFKCPGYYCIPWSYVCDGKWDCPSGYDEWKTTGCGIKRECHNFFKCSYSQLCIHLGDICNNINDCPMRDDEVLCTLKEATCPSGCICLTFAISCSDINSTFLPTVFPFKIVYLHSCPNMFVLNILVKLSSMAILSLKYDKLNHTCKFLPSLSHTAMIDTSHNRITRIEKDCFHTAINLVILKLNNNLLFTINLQLLEMFERLQYLDISNNFLLAVESNCYFRLFSMKILSLLNNSLTYIPKNAFEGFQLMLLITKDYRLCCIVPSNAVCTARIPWYLSCHTLLMHNYIKVSLYCFSLIMVSLNILSIIFQHAETSTVVGRMIISINMANLSFGLYLIMLWITDLVYDEHFVLRELTWKSGPICFTVFGMVLNFSLVSPLLLSYSSLSRLMIVLFPRDTHFKDTTFVTKHVILIFLTTLSLSIFFTILVWSLYKIVTISICFPFVDPTGSVTLIKVIPWLTIILQFLSCLFILTVHVKLLKALKETQNSINPFRTEDFLIFLSIKLIFWVHLLNKSRKIQYIWHYFFNGT